ncbi:MAG: AlpA family phage regulatory protein [Magnetococcales bacterium]|nr:AlpA family phage regulatory protein [Magnetococcales bacterium]
MAVHALLSEKIFLTKPEILEITGGSRSWLDELRSNGGFPAPVQLGPRRIAWRVQDVQNWLESLQPAPALTRTTPPKPTEPKDDTPRRGRGRPRKVIAISSV